MLESPSALESPRDPFTGALWWTESNFDGSPCRNGSFASVKGNLRRLKESRTSEPDLSLDAARTKLTWVSREDHMSSSGSSGSQNLSSNDRLSIQNGSMNGRSGRFGGADSPRRAIQSPAESPARRGESVRRIRTPSMDSADTTRIPSSAAAIRRLRSLNHAHLSASFKEGSGVAKSDHAVVKEAPAIWRGLTSTAVVRDQWTAPKPIVTDQTTNEYSPESDRLVVSYLAEETDRIIKERIQKLKLQFHSNAPDQLRTTDHKRSSAGETTRTTGTGRWPLSRHFDNTKAERVTETYDDMNRDQVRVGDHELDDESSNSPASSMPGSPSLPISRLLPQYNGFSTIGEGNASPSTVTISATMENYLDNRRRGSNMGPQVVVTPRPTAPPSLSRSAALSRLNLAVVRQPADEPENPSASSNGNRVGRHESFTASFRAALSPINGNEDVTHSTTSLSQTKRELYSTGELRIAGEDPSIRGTQSKEATDSKRIARDSTESVQQMQQQGENGFPSRLEHSEDFLGNGVEMDSGESPRRQLIKQGAKRTSLSARKELETKIAPAAFESNGTRGRVDSSQTLRRPVGGSARYPAVARDLLGQSQSDEPEIGKSLLSDKVLSAGLRDKHNASRGTQSCRRDSIVKSLLDSSQENKPRPPAVNRNKIPASPGGHETSSNSKNSSRSSVTMRVISSSDTLPKPSALISQIEKQKLLSTDLSDHKSSPRRISTAAPESRAIPLSTLRRISVVAPPELGRSPLSLSSSRPSSVGGAEAAGENTLSRSRRYSVAAGPELCRKPLGSFSQPLQRSKSPTQSPTLKAKHQRMDTSSQSKSGGPHMDSPIQSSRLSANKKNSLQLERPKMSHKSSLSLDQQDTYTRLFVQTKKENQTGQPVTTSTSVSQACSMPSSMTVAKAQTPSSPGSSFQRWLANQFKVGSKSRSSSTGKDRDPQEEPKPRKKSPWRAKSAEILRVITRKKGSSPRRPTVPLTDVDASKVQRVQQGNSFDSETSQSSMSASDPWHHRMMHIEASSTPTHRKFYVLPAISTLSPAHTSGVQSQLKDHLRHTSGLQSQLKDHLQHTPRSQSQLRDHLRH